MEFQSAYTAKKPDAKGFVDYTEEDHRVWEALYARQIKIVQGRACDEHLKGLKLLNIPTDHIPQLPDINKALSAITGWMIEPVAALISQEAFFDLLAHRKFPAATFIRSWEELNYVKEPDMFHEIFGHCPILTDPVYADFMQDYAKFVLTLPEADWPLMQRLYWFTVEFGLIQTAHGLRAYGGGILSSIEETVYCVESDKPLRKPLGSGLDALRTPYRIDIVQPIYFVINAYQELYDLMKSDVKGLLAQAHALGEFDPVFTVDDSPNVHIHFC